jgi:hypothetical protein
MPDIITDPIPRDSLRELIHASRRTPVTMAMMPLTLDEMLAHERTTEKELVIELVKRKRRQPRMFSPYLVVPVGFVAGIVLGVLALAF